jgi:hypothetical protein
LVLINFKYAISIEMFILRFSPVDSVSASITEPNCLISAWMSHLTLR